MISGLFLYMDILHERICLLQPKTLAIVGFCLGSGTMLNFSTIMEHSLSTCMKVVAYEAYMDGGENLRF
jgi:dienelactone hydrolase